MPLPVSIFEEEKDLRYLRVVDMSVQVRTITTREGEELEKEYVVVECEDVGNPDLEFNWEFSFPVSRRRNSKWMTWLRDFSRLGLRIRSEEDLKGLCFLAEVKDIDAGRVTYTRYPEPVRVFASLEEMKAAIEAGEASIEAEEEVSAAETEVSTGGAKTLPPEYLELKKHLLGKTFAEAIPSILADPKLAGKKELISSLLENKAPITALIKAGELVEQDGRYIEP